MNILMIGQLPKEAGGNYTTGAAKVVYELSKQSVEGVTVYTFATNTSESSAQKICSFPNQYVGYKLSIIGMLKDVFCHPVRTWLEWKHYIKIDHQNPFRYAFYKSNIRRAIGLTRPDLIHVHGIGVVSPAWFAMNGKQIPLLMTCHGIFYRGEESDVIGRDRYYGNLPHCDYFTGLTNDARHEFTDILGVQPEKYSIIPNGVDTTKFYYSKEWRTKIRQELSVGDNTTVFLTVASLQDRKGQLAFLKILEQLEIDYQYWLIGLGPDKDAIEEFVYTNRLDGIVKLIGYRNSDELFKYYSAADIYAHPSWKEGQALSEIEAYATGLRTIVNKAVAGTLVDDANNSRQYCIVDFDDVKPDAIKNWLERNDNERVSRANYDWNTIASKYALIYNNLVARRFN
jgi:glycosyltransferase involved in cell wall biosynthesis